MKRLILLVMVLLFVLSSCGSGENAPSNEDDLSLEDQFSLQQEQNETGGTSDSVLDNQPESLTKDSPENSGETSSDSEPDAPVTKKLVVPEGYTLARIGMTLDQMEICTTQEFIDATENGDFSEFSLMQEQTYNENRAFKLEGYLFPATYEVYVTDSPDTIIRKMLAHTESQISPSLRQEIYNRGYTIDQVIILASIIEKEAYERNDNPVPQEMPRISSVLYNRLDLGMKLQCDVTINYVEGAIKPFITGDKDRYNEYYNTYKADALPSGAICNPSLDAIIAAASPADTDFLFFLTDDNKNFYYSDTFEEHEVLVEKYL